jgi:hypothetical protein
MCMRRRRVQKTSLGGRLPDVWLHSALLIRFDWRGGCCAASLASRQVPRRLLDIRHVARHYPRRAPPRVRRACARRASVQTCGLLERTHASECAARSVAHLHPQVIICANRRPRIHVSSKHYSTHRHVDAGAAGRRGLGRRGERGEGATRHGCGAGRAAARGVLAVCAAFAQRSAAVRAPAACCAPTRTRRSPDWRRVLHTCACALPARLRALAGGLSSTARRIWAPSASWRSRSGRSGKRARRSGAPRMTATPIRSGARDWRQPLRRGRTSRLQAASRRAAAAAAATVRPGRACLRWWRSPMSRSRAPRKRARRRRPTRR